MLACATGDLGSSAADNLVRFAVAVGAGGRGRARGRGFGVEAVRVCQLRVAVAIGAGDLLRGRSWARLLTSLWQSTQVNMLPWMECLSLVAVDEEADGLAVISVGQGRVGVAGEAVLVFWLLLGVGRPRPDE